jgi:ubiquinone/menaquinone biosynthesis C-methylase UbiE
MVDIDRWIKAQQAEADHEAHSSGFTPRDHARSYFEDYWDCSIETVRDEIVLSVGGGTGIIHTLEHPKLQVSIDPLYGRSGVDLDRSSAVNIGGCGEKLPLRDDYFDTVISFNVLDHTQNPGAVLDEIFRVLKDGGRFLFAVNTFDVPGFSERGWT